jgi:hypothetical protein
MAASNEWTEWHLTPRGWERGDRQLDFGQRYDGPSTPADRVLSATYSEYCQRNGDPLSITTKETWSCENKDAVSSLLKQFGPAPDHL